MSSLRKNCSVNKKVPRRHGREPSKGCEMCRQQKIKCDESRPSCSRCRKRGLNCAYRDYSLLMFRDETVSTASKVRQRVWTKQQERTDGQALAVTLGEPKHIHLPIQPIAVNRFFHDFVVASQPILRNRNSNGGFLPMIPEMFHRCQPLSCFSLALSAAANANFARRHNSGEARWQSLRDYTQALRQLRQDLQRQGGRLVTADMLAASSLLAMYELLVSRDLAQRLSFTTHVNGAMTLLRNEDQAYRGTYGLARGFQDVIFQKLIDCLVMGTHPKLLFKGHSSLIPQDTLPAPLLVSMYRTAQFCATWKDYYLTRNKLGQKQQELEMEKLLKKCRLLDDEIKSWTQSKLADMAVVNLVNTKLNIPLPFRSLFAALGAPENLHLCADINQTHQYNFFKACRLTILRTMMAIVDTSLALTTITKTGVAGYMLVKARILENMIEVVDDLLSTVFSALTVHVPGKADSESITEVPGFRGLGLLWPLHTAGTCLIQMGQHRPDRSAKLEWVRTLLRCIRDDLGIQTANYFLQHNREAFIQTPST